MTPSANQELTISAQGLARIFPTEAGDVYALRDVSLNVLRGQLLAITGRSGSGKTTLLNLLGGLDRATDGTVLFRGQDFSTMSEARLTELRRRHLGFVFQSYGLLPILSAYENVELPLRINGVPRSERRNRVQESLELMGIAPRARHRPDELSGGEQQRVAIARALVARPSVLFADEPTGELDSATGLTIATVLRDVAHAQGVAVVVSSHDLALANMADRVIELADGGLIEK